ncbi:MAG: DUF3570 domain-containing protein [Gammaproteobacteria bacterium]|nr:DUF3570 domain-containing protein [Gammaproteobacteria bacterium]
MAVAVAAATSTLLGTTASAESSSGTGWDIRTSILYYGESDDRVEDLSLSIRAERTSESGQSFVFGVTTDSLTGATPTGAVLGAATADQPQTFTRPSSRGTYVATPGEVPTDDSFKDTRIAGNVSLRQPFAESWAVTFGLTYSDEYDYSHVGANASISREFNRKNTVINLGTSYANDEIYPEGGVPYPLSPMRLIGDDTSKLGRTEDKEVVDFLIGVTQVIDVRTIAQLNYSYSYIEGYQTDPYKILTVLDDATGMPVPGLDPGLFLYRFESRPYERTKHSLFAKIKRAMGKGIFDVSYRYMTDDWGIDSHTVDSHYRFALTPRQYLEPHLRYYRQSEADFFRTNLLVSEPLPWRASADYRLAEFTGLTVGLKYGFRFSDTSEMSVRVEWYAQSGNSKLEGVPLSTNVFPDLDAGIVQLNYRFRL